MNSKVFAVLIMASLIGCIVGGGYRIGAPGGHGKAIHGSNYRTWGNWSHWSRCSGHCGRRERQTRSRRCVYSRNYGHHGCVGSSVQTRYCPYRSCGYNPHGRRFFC
ncbi:hypothetical protein EB796_025246 [Bugula neritina]|uniref:Uncharacterized protein n=1 Tax=Bugula neritina TaxID=10212 RepID=A0A7J7IR77_BUGNE|nr:hypothetical protein EB796_025246 [Bugula neritina]